MTAPSTRPSSTAKPAARSRPRPRSVPSVVSTRPRPRSARPLSTRRRAVLITAALGAATTLLEAATGTIGSLWPVIPVTMLLAALGSALTPILRAGRAEHDAESQRLADLERAARHQSLAAIDAMSGSEFDHFV